MSAEPSSNAAQQHSPVLTQAIADARQRDADMAAHLAGQLDGPTIDDIAQPGEWGQLG